MELAHSIVTCTHVHIHTHYTPAVAEVALLELLDMCISLQCPAGERPVVAEGSQPL